MVAIKKARFFGNVVYGSYGVREQEGRLIDPLLSSPFLWCHADFPVEKADKGIDIHAEASSQSFIVRSISKRMGNESHGFDYFVRIDSGFEALLGHMQKRMIAKLFNTQRPDEAVLRRIGQRIEQGVKGLPVFIVKWKRIDAGLKRIDDGAQIEMDVKLGGGSSAFGGKRGMGRNDNQLIGFEIQFLVFVNNGPSRIGHVVNSPEGIAYRVMPIRQCRGPTEENFHVERNQRNSGFLVRMKIAGFQAFS